jgi:hypothetical protein
VSVVSVSKAARLLKTEKRSQEIRVKRDRKKILIGNGHG